MEKNAEIVLFACQKVNDLKQKKYFPQELITFCNSNDKIHISMNRNMLSDLFPFKSLILKQ